MLNFGALLFGKMGGVQVLEELGRRERHGECQ
jgi:hypothetical protein